MRKIFLIALMLTAAPALAEPTRDEVMAGATRCYGIADNRAWLDCFYGSAQPMRSLLGLAPAPVSQTRLVPPVGAGYGATYVAPAAPRLAAAAPPPRERSGGFFSDIIGSTKPVASNVPMASYKFGRDRTFTVTLQNGDVYQQLESDTVFADWKRPASSYLVTVNAQGDKYVMKVKGEPGVTFKVNKR